jgi:hypothetical protein
MSDADLHRVIGSGLLHPYISLMFLESTSEREQHNFSKP